MVNDGESVTLQCRVGNANSFDVVWLHNEKEIKPSKDFEYERISDGTDKICKLRIAEIFPEDAGTYTCEVFNDVGEAFSTCTLNVVGKLLLADSILYRSMFFLCKFLVQLKVDLYLLMFLSSL